MTHDPGETMRTIAVAASIVAAALLVGCGSSDTGDARYDARQACTSIDAGHGISPTSAPTPAGDTDWSGLSDALNQSADSAAAAAAKDGRWNRLADSLNTLQRLAAGLAQQQGSVDSAYASSPVLSPEDQQLATDTLAIVQSECRKAYAAG
ncbi:hypothetical protein [Streptomyces panaciradicis]|uniref:hypothetical protein n=1 Tax=Streptomyces panaciradicis TaxID=1470261 RepID=UPI00201CC6C0|nr:hypothetical protein [Streptomyces panaciradicis]MCL6669553.1 hypothetical protein [Streptomyces panaciradicis]